jgi:calcium-dependent protein kinase
MLKALTTEIELMKSLKDEHVVRLEDSQIGKKNTYIILELCDSDLRKKMEKNGGNVPEEEAIQIYSHIIKGFKYLTGLGYIHRDIKPENTLIKGNLYKVADFGFSCKADIGCIKKLDFMCGTPLYMCPQLLNEQAYTAKCDIWSLGVMLYEIIFGYSPWVCRNLESYKQNIMTRPLAFPYNSKIGEHTKDFIKKCLVVD